MKTFALLFLLVGASVAAPQYGNRPSRPRPSPQKQCRTINEVKYVEEFNTVCNTIYDYQLCLPTSRQQCDQKRRQKCVEKYRTEYDTIYEKVCDDAWSNECDKVWKEDGYGGKVWEEDPTSCKQVKRTDCKDVPRQVPRQEPYQACDWENYQDCYQVPGAPNCQLVGQSHCHERANGVKGGACKQIPRQDCKEVHREVPKQVSRQVCSGDPEWDDVRDGPYSATGVANAFNQATIGGGGGVRNAVIGTKEVSSGNDDSEPVVPGVRQADVDGIDDALNDDDDEADPDDDAIVFGR